MILLYKELIKQYKSDYEIKKLIKIGKIFKIEKGIYSDQKNVNYLKVLTKKYPNLFNYVIDIPLFLLYKNLYFYLLYKMVLYQWFLFYIKRTVHNEQFLFLLHNYLHNTKLFIIY